VSRRIRALGLCLLVLVAGAVVLWPGGGTNTASADFVRTVGLYKGSDVRILGVKVGQVTSVEPHGRYVRVTFQYDDKYRVPADAKAAIVSPSVVSDRYVQLTPVYRRGPALADGASIPLRHTAVPVELDRIYSSLNDLDVGLGPKGANKNGALSRLLKVGAANLGGEGTRINQTVRDFSTAIGTLSDGRSDLFGTVRNLQVFTTALAGNDQQVRSFNQDLAGVADQLAGERGELALALRNLAVALGEVSSFVKSNRATLSSDLRGLADVSSTLAKEKTALAEILEAGPTALSNLQLAYNPTSGTLDTRNNAEQFQDPELYLCSLMTSVGLPKSSCDQLDQILKHKKFRAPLPAGALPAGSSVPDRTLGGILGSGQ
jgi:phospholipid/cholesterol/gamma-HCH transport system substrate-binding protein